MKERRNYGKLGFVIEGKWKALYRNGEHTDLLDVDAQDEFNSFISKLEAKK